MKKIYIFSTFLNTITGDKGLCIDLPGVTGLRGEDGFQGEPGTYSNSFCYSSSGVDQHQLAFYGSYLGDVKCLTAAYRPDRTNWTDWRQGYTWF